MNKNGNEALKGGPEDIRERLFYNDHLNTIQYNNNCCINISIINDGIGK